MRASMVAILVLYTLGMSIGQVLFKISADRAKARTGDGLLFALFGDVYFLLALAVYGGLTLVWVWVLTRVPLSRAYPFVVLAFVFTPALATVFFGEPLTGWYLLGLGLIVFGLSILVWKAG